jgi:hypothetical protein
LRAGATRRGNRLGTLQYGGPAGRRWSRKWLVARRGGAGEQVGGFVKDGFEVFGGKKALDDVGDVEREGFVLVAGGFEIGFELEGVVGGGEIGWVAGGVELVGEGGGGREGGGVLFLGDDGGRDGAAHEVRFRDELAGQSLLGEEELEGFVVLLESGISHAGLEEEALEVAVAG